MACLPNQRIVSSCSLFLETHLWRLQNVASASLSCPDVECIRIFIIFQIVSSDQDLIHFCNADFPVPPKATVIMDGIDILALLKIVQSMLDLWPVARIQDLEEIEKLRDIINKQPTQDLEEIEKLRDIINKQPTRLVESFSTGRNTKSVVDNKESFAEIIAIKGLIRDSPIWCLTDCPGLGSIFLGTVDERGSLLSFMGSYFSEWEMNSELPDVSHRDDEMVNPQTWRKCIHNGLLAASQIVLITMMGNYKHSIRDHPTRTGEPELSVVVVQSAMLWLCSHLKCVPALASQMVLSPNPLPLRSKRN